MLSSQKALLSIIDSAYEAAISPDLWPEVIGEVTRHTCANSGMIVIENYQDNQIYDFIGRDLPNGSLERYTEYYAEKDIWTSLLYSADEDQFHDCTDFISYQKFVQTEGFVDFFRGYNMHSAAGYRSRLNHKLNLRLGFQCDRPRFDTQSLRFLNLIKNHMNKSVQLYADQNEIGLIRNQFDSIRPHIALAVVNASGKIVDGNELFFQLAERSYVFSELKGFINFLPQKTHYRVLAGIRRVIQSFNEIDVSKGTAKYILDNGLSEKYQLTISPYIHILHDQRRYSALLTFTPVADKAGHGARVLSQEFGLTDQELEIVCGLCNGKSIIEIAKDRARSEHTLRTQLKKILYKLSCDNQNQLVHTVLTLFSVYR